MNGFRGAMTSQGGDLLDNAGAHYPEHIVLMARNVYVKFEYSEFTIYMDYYSANGCIA